MTRWIITALALSAISALAAAPGCAATGVGDPCIPDEEYDPTFQGFSVADVSVESKSYVCLSRLCLVNHFQGRVTCPYGQAGPGVGCNGSCSVGAAPTSPSALPAAMPGSPPSQVNNGQGYQYGCSIPGSVPAAGTTGWEVSATNVNVPLPTGAQTGWIPGQVTGNMTGDRTANQAVYCSCHCANTQGQTNDGETYCACPENYTCTQLVTSIMAGTNQGLTGGYCVKNGTQYAPATTFTQNQCDPTATNSQQPGFCPLQY